MNRSKLTLVTRGILFAFAILAVIALGIMGCDSKTTFVPTTDPNTAAATFVGNDVQTCGSCHADKASQYALQAHGKNFHNADGGQDLIAGRNGACAPCHTVGFQEPSGYVNEATTPQLGGIGCQECHGPGSKHVAAPSKSNIRKNPDAQNTCWDCHVPSYKMAKSNPGPTTDMDLANTAPGKVAAHHPQTIMLIGTKGFGTAMGPAAHGLIDNTCVTCHMRNASQDHGENMPLVDLDACATCHGNPASLKTRFQTEIKAKLIQIGGATAEGEPDETGSGGLLATFAAANNIDLTSTTARGDAVKAYKAARYNWDYVIADKSLGIHNPPYAELLLNEAIAKLGGTAE